MDKVTFSSSKIVKDGSGLWLCLNVTDPLVARRIVAKMGGKLCDAEIREHRKKRSLDANAYAWVLIDKLATALSAKKTDIYRNAIREIGGVSTTICVTLPAADKLIDTWGQKGLGWFAEREQSKINGCVNLTLYYGSSVFDTAQMSRLIDLLVQDCKALGIETLPPDKLAAMVEGWDAH